MQIAINLVLRFPNSQYLRLPSTASMRSLFPPHCGQLQIKSVIFVISTEYFQVGGWGRAPFEELQPRCADCRLA